MIMICKKAGRLILGFDAVKKNILNGKVKMVLLTQDVSENTKKEALFVCENSSIKCYSVPYTMEHTEFYLSKKSAVLGVADEGFSVSIENLIKHSF
jgi:ribosomal protein L7Ae-like RNA K-turn-binding protein